MLRNCCHLSFVICHSSFVYVETIGLGWGGFRLVNGLNRNLIGKPRPYRFKITQSPI
ncbi:hypothetical protein [Coleofasciculus sp. F4-SAH-05]|uniref:hypothetical protein n=1 Tax=Coleofasciculus sp. F4-SAH-05 TaxID=3069525 RepID=UPI003302A4CB